jgi:hypothetical protein
MVKPQTSWSGIASLLAWGVGAYLRAAMPALTADIRLALRCYFAEWLNTPRK